MTELVLRDVDTRQWFSTVGADGSVPDRVQKQVAELFVQLVRDEAAVAYLEKVEPTPPPGTTALLIPYTNINVRLEGFSKDQVAIFAGLIATLITSGHPLSAVAAEAAAILLRLRTLDTAEIAMVKSFIENELPWVPREVLISDFASRHSSDGLAVLRRMQGRGLVEESAGDWRMVR
jgi:hypothetical protein